MTTTPTIGEEEAVPECFMTNSELAEAIERAEANYYKSFAPHREIYERQIVRLLDIQARRAEAGITSQPTPLPDRGQVMLVLFTSYTHSEHNAKVAVNPAFVQAVYSRYEGDQYSTEIMGFTSSKRAGTYIHIADEPLLVRETFEEVVAVLSPPTPPDSPPETKE